MIKLYLRVYFCFKGGLKAVVWTDAVQMLIVMGGTLTIAIMGANKVGGPSEVWDIVKEDNRINFDLYYTRNLTHLNFQTVPVQCDDLCSKVLGRC